MYYSKTMYKNLQENFGPDIIGKKLGYKQISRKLNKIFKKDGIKIRTYQDRSMTGDDAEYFYFSGYFDPDEKIHPINIFIHLEPKKRYFHFTEKNYSIFIFGLSQTIQHELIHLSQHSFKPSDSELLVDVRYTKTLSKSRKVKIDYLREWDEIEAYAHDIAMELNYYYKDYDSKLLLKKIDELPDVSTYRYYKEAFRGTKWGRVRKVLLKKVWRWMPHAEVPNFIE